MSKEKIYRITCTEEQLKLIQQCVEDCHRFACGQVEMSHTIAGFDNEGELHQALDAEIKDLVTPELSRNASWSWDGGRCINKWQRRFIAKTYPIYREILHFFAVQGGYNNVYTSHTLTCEEGGTPIKIEEV